MNAVSVCDGISAASMACEGLDYKFLLLSEIEAFPRSVLKQRHRAVDQRRYQAKHSAAGRPVLWGDFTTLRPRHLRRLHGHADVDVLFGGTPCQSFSVAGKRAGLDDPRGDLSLEYALLAYRLGVRWFLWENVPGVLSSAKGQDFAAILSAFTGRVVEVPRDGWQTAGIIPAAGPGQFGVAWRVFDAQYAGVPQRRRRVFVVGYLGDWRRAAAVLFERHSLQGHPAPRRKAGEGLTHDVAPCLGASGRGFERTGDTRGQDCLVASRGQDCLVASTGDIAHCLNAGGMGRQDYETETLIAHALRGEGFDASEDGTGRGTPLVPMAFAQNSRDEVRIFGGDGQTVGAIAAEPGMKQQTYVAFSCKDYGNDASDISPTLRSMGHATSHPNAGGQVAVAFRAAGQDGFTPSHIAPPITSTDGGGAGVPTVSYGLDEEQNAVENGFGCLKARKEGGGFEGTVMTPTMAVRRLTPRECERLQGFPDDYTLVTHRGKPAADGPRYKSLGNSWAVPCARWIAERMEMVDRI